MNKRSIFLIFFFLFFISQLHSEEINSLSLSASYLLPGNNVTITYNVGETTKVYTSIIDQNGNAIKVLENGVQKSPGNYSLTWDGKNTSGQNASDGTYTVKVRSAMGSIKSRTWSLAPGPYNSPYDLDFEPDGTMWVTFPSERKIKHITTDGTVLEEIGKIGGTGADNGEFFYPTDIIVDDATNLYVVDYFNISGYERIWKYTKASNKWSIFFPDNADMSVNQYGSIDVRYIGGLCIDKGDTNTASDDKIVFMAYLLDANYRHTLFCYDINNNKIWTNLLEYTGNADYYKFGTIESNNGTNKIFLTRTLDSGRYIRTYNMNDGNYISYIDLNSVGAIPEDYYHYNGITSYYDSGATTTYLYIIRTERNNHHAIDIIKNSGSAWSYESLTYGNNQFGSGQKWYAYPRGITYHNNKLYIAEFDNHRIQVLNRSDLNFDKFINLGDVSSWGINAPDKCDVDSAGNVYIADKYNSRILILDSDGNFVSSIGSAGSLLDNNFKYPEGVDVDENGYIWIVDTGNAKLKKFDKNGTYLTGIDLGGIGINTPTDVFVKESYAYVLDITTDRVHKLDDSFNSVLDFNDGGLPFNNPRGVFVDSSDNIWVADTYDYYFRMYLSDGSDPDTNVYFYRYTWDMVQNPDTGYYYGVTQYEHTSYPRIHYFSKSATIGSEKPSYTYYGINFYLIHPWSPQGIALDSKGNLYVTSSDYRNSTLIKYSVVSLKEAGITIDGTSPDSRITSPVPNQTVKGTWTVQGTANDANFKKYSLYYGVGSNPELWFIITESKETPVINGTLGEWDTTVLSSAYYTLKLVVYDKTDQPTTYTVGVNVAESDGNKIIDSIKVYPNPSNPDEFKPIINYWLLKFSHIKLQILSCNMEVVKVLYHGIQLTGEYKYEWDGKYNSGETALNGVYFYRLEIESGDKEEVKTGKIVIIR